MKWTHLHSQILLCQGQWYHQLSLSQGVQFGAGQKPKKAADGPAGRAK